MRPTKYYPVEQRRYVYNNLQCEICGNTEYFCFDLKLRHSLKLKGGALILATHSKAQSIIENALEKNRGLFERDPPLVHCANCQDGYVDSQERLLEYCWERGCPGCRTCGSYIDKEEMISICTECIRDRDGAIREEDCYSICPVYEEGLQEVREHYDLTLDDVKLQAGY